jgi:zinc D-Ala-D-Ala dipeptidase
MLYKIALHRYIFSLLILFFFHLPRAAAQHTITSKYGVSVIDKMADYQQTVRQEPAKLMVALQTLKTNIIYDLRYATANNFMHRPMYMPKPRHTFLRLPAATALVQVQTALNSKGYGLKIFDAYRPYSVTVSFWELVKDERYVANPSKGSGHNRGLAVDLTIIDLATKKELDMGTGFDNFTDTAHHSFTNLAPGILQNRKLLKETMERHGFTALETEWWHYYWPNDRKYEVLDIPFGKLGKMKKLKL